MKTEKLFSRIGRTALIAATLLAATMFTGCSSESDAPNPDAEQTGEPRVHIYFGTPAMAVGTRADQQSADGKTMPVTDSEAAIKSLYLFVYSVKTTDGTETSKLTFAYNLTTNISGNVKNWTEASPAGGLALPKGDYKFYLLANVDKFRTEASFAEITTTGALPSSLIGQGEDFIKNLEMDKLLVISQNNVTSNNLGNTNFGLPMAMMCEDVMTGGALDSGNDIVNPKTYTDNGGVVSIEDQSINLYCDMTFLCSAVRCSFLYDKETFSWDIASFAPVTPALTISNIVAKETLGSTATNDGDFTEAKFTGAIGGTYILKDGETEYSFSQFIDNPFTLKTTISSINVSQAYQSVIYLPSNYSMTKKTELAFQCELMPTTSNVKNKRTFHISLPNSETDDTTPANQLARGYFYDIIGKISSTGADFQVSVKKWENSTKQAIPL